MMEFTEWRLIFYGVLFGSRVRSLPAEVAPMGNIECRPPRWVLVRARADPSGQYGARAVPKGIYRMRDRPEGSRSETCVFRMNPIGRLGGAAKETYEM